MKLILLPCINREKNKIKGYKQNIRKYTSVLLICFVKAFVLMTGKSLLIQKMETWGEWFSD